MTRLGSLVAPKALTVKALRRAGLQLQVAVPDGARALRLQLLPRRGKRTGAAVATAMVRLSAGGAQRIHWRLPAATVKRLEGRPLHPPGPGGQGCPFDRTGPARAHARAARPLTPGATPTDGRRRPARFIPRRAPSALCGSRLAVEGRGRAPRVRIRSARVPELPMRDGMPGADREPLTLRRAAGWSLVAGLCVAAAVAVVAVLTGSFDDTDWRVIASSLGFSVFAGAAAAGAAVRLRPEPWAGPLGGACVAASAAAYGLLLGGLWVATDADGLWRAFGIAALAALWTSHAALVLRSRRPDDGALVRRLAPPLHRLSRRGGGRGRAGAARAAGRRSTPSRPRACSPRSSS